MLQMSELISILWYIHTTKQYKGMNVITWMNLKIIMVSERSQTPPKKNLHMIPLL